MEEAIDNEASKKLMRKLGGDEEAVYEKESTAMYMKMFWVAASLGLFYLNYNLFIAESLQGHFVSFVSGVMAIKGYQTVEPFLDLAEKEGLVYSREKREEDQEGGEVVDEN